MLQEDGHLSRAEDLSSFDLALSIHSAAPRIEAHFQYYETAVLPTLNLGDEVDCESWVYVPFTGNRYCHPDMEEFLAQPLGKPGDAVPELPFDRVLGVTTSDKPSVVYADISSPFFRQFHKTISKTAKEGKTSYRVRYKPTESDTSQPLLVSGYGVELALKRTDYIVIDDREKDEAKDAGTVKPEDATLSEEDVSDLRPLSSSELRRLGIKAASFVLANEAPFDTLVKLSQDFPKHSGSIAATNISEEFLKEHHENRGVILPPGFNVMWINGVQIMGRDMDAYALLEHLRRERKMINSVRELDLSGPEAVDLLSHEAITASQMEQDTQRYDWRDETEGGNVIIWLNDIEKDKRYAEWTSSITGVLQRTFPGQLPPVRKEIHHLTFPVDFSDYADVTLVTETIQSFVKRKLPIRFGLVPILKSPAGVEQARAVYHLFDTYGLAAALGYLEKSVAGAGRKHKVPQEKYFTKAIEEKVVRRDQTPLTLPQVLEDTKLHDRLLAAQNYAFRLGASDPQPPILVNGVPITKSDEWLQSMGQRLTLDNRIVQQAVYEEEVTEEDYLPELFLSKASLKRNPVIVPEDDKTARHLVVGDLPFDSLPSLPASKDTIESELVHLTVAADLDSEAGFELAMEALLFQKEHDNVEVALLHVSNGADPEKKLLSPFGKSGDVAMVESLVAQYGLEARNMLGEDAKPDFAQRKTIYQTVFQAAAMEIESATTKEVERAWVPAQSIATACGMTAGQKAIILNGRLAGPINGFLEVNADDLEALLAYERKKRLLPASAAIKALNLQGKADTPLAFARVSNLIALSLVSDIPEGIFEAAPTVRTDVFKKWNSTHTAIKIGNRDSATIQIHASIDPASEVAQRWIPIVKVLSELDGVYLCLYLNPKERLEELPVKRFYRYVLDSKPAFADDGAVRGLSARFAGLPAEALLNMGMDLPPSWLVAPEDSVHDLDNIKLSAVKSGSDIEATYELEHILIEGHSRDVTLGPPPRGAQLVLGTKLDPHFADTIIMANLGYFQFKTNPGIYSLALQKGRSQEIFKIDSAGSKGYTATPGDESTEIALMSFRGATLFPRLSRKPNMEEEDVLEASSNMVDDLANQADKLLKQAGVKSAGKYLNKAAKFGSKMLSKSGKAGNLEPAEHADINIFSVASGHLYERMLNIMMVSVMKHTKHTVKFWFIEQFLSPSFKAFLPVMAKEYGFRYEMVTYKWPHWLRGQKEKQREIWGYKILFLDVLFPLDLDKVIFVDADQIVRTDMYDLVQHDLQGAPYGFTPMCDSRTEMEGFRFWKQGYWKNFLRGLPYHISALYVVDLKEFRRIAAGDRLRQQYHQLSADPASLSNLDQDLPNHMQMVLPIHSLPQEWLWCETWCSDEALKEARTIDLCNNPQTKEPKLDRARRQVPEWTMYDNEIAAVAKKAREGELAGGEPVAGDAGDAGVQGEEEESIQERLQREDAEREQRKAKAEEKLRTRDEL